MLTKRFVGPGTYRFIVPEGVPQVIVRAKGGDGGGTDDEPGEAAGIVEHLVDVFPGQIIEIVIGAGGEASGSGVPGNPGFVEIAQPTPAND